MYIVDVLCRLSCACFISLISSSILVASGVGGNASNANVCDSIRCPRGRVCLLNIQGLPMCRCPSVFQCRRLPDRPVCSTDGRHFKNRCFLSVEECVSARTLSTALDGRCNAELVMTSTILRQQATSAPPTSAARLHLQQQQTLVCYVLCYMVICIAPLTGGYSEAISA